MPQPDISDPNIPSVGQPYQVVSWWAQAIVVCKCQEKTLHLMVLTGVGNLVPCQNCGKLYSISGFGLKDGNVTANVDCIIPTDPKKVM